MAQRLRIVLLVCGPVFLFGLAALGILAWAQSTANDQNLSLFWLDERIRFSLAGVAMAIVILICAAKPFASDPAPATDASAGPAIQRLAALSPWLLGVGLLLLVFGWAQIDFRLTNDRMSRALHEMPLMDWRQWAFEVELIAELFVLGFGAILLDGAMRELRLSRIGRLFWIVLFGACNVVLWQWILQVVGYLFDVNLARLILEHMPIIKGDAIHTFAIVSWALRAAVVFIVWKTAIRKSVSV